MVGLIWTTHPPTPCSTTLVSLLSRCYKKISQYFSTQTLASCVRMWFSIVIYKCFPIHPQIWPNLPPFPHLHLICRLFEFEESWRLLYNLDNFFPPQIYKLKQKPSWYHFSGLISKLYLFDILLGGIWKNPASLNHIPFWDPQYLSQTHYEESSSKPWVPFLSTFWIYCLSYLE